MISDNGRDGTSTAVQNIPEPSHKPPPPRWHLLQDDFMEKCVMRSSSILLLIMLTVGGCAESANETNMQNNSQSIPMEIGDLEKKRLVSAFTSTTKMHAYRVDPREYSVWGVLSNPDRDPLCTRIQRKLDANQGVLSHCSSVSTNEISETLALAIEKLHAGTPSSCFEVTYVLKTEGPALVYILLSGNCDLAAVIFSDTTKIQHVSMNLKDGVLLAYLDNMSNRR
ncbi:MAG: hypothetical protein KDB68_07880 [Planctomycetes bacterium]|nr:hypothetical protein [Planctomycetota bacterium]MCA8936111.1 hypothetical protein [Planctomycetota bacterium]